MTHIPSNSTLAFDSSSVEFLQSATDIGEVIALLAGGVRPDPDRLSRLCISLRAIQTYLIDGGRERARFEEAEFSPTLATKEVVHA